MNGTAVGASPSEPRGWWATRPKVLAKARPRHPGIAVNRFVSEPRSDRLDYRSVCPADAPTLQRIARDDHVRRYLLDGVLVPDGWADAEIRRAQGLRRATGLGLYLVHESSSGDDEPVGFCGFRVFDEHGPEPELLYALLEPATGRGYATEAALACVELAWALGRPYLVAAVDEVNGASLRVLEKVGFRRTGTGRGVLGSIVFFELDLRGSGAAPVAPATRLSPP